MKRVSSFSTIFVTSLLFLGALTVADAQRRRSPRSRNPPIAQSQLTGTYRLNPSNSDDPQDIASRATENLSSDIQQSEVDRLISRLQAPEILVIERHGTSLSIGSSIAPQLTLVADGREHQEQLSNGRMIRTTASFIGNRFEVNVTGNSGNNFHVVFTPVNNGRSLSVTRSIDSEQIQTPITAQSSYDRSSDIAQWNQTGQGNLAGNPAGYQNGYNGRNGNSPYGQTDNGQNNNRDYVQNNDRNFVIPNNTTLEATLNESLSSNATQQNDRFTLTVNSPNQYQGAVIEGHVSSIDQSGRLTGRSRMTMSFDQIRLSNGRNYPFAGYLTTVHSANGNALQVDNEGTVQGGSQTTRTEERAAIGTGIGAIIGAIAGGGKGAVIGALVGAGGGAGSVYAQGRENLDLQAGARMRIQATGPVNR
jgi:hypothetical protein